MDLLSRRIQKAAESFLDNEGLISGLDQSSAELLQNWGISHAKKAAEKTESLDDERAEEIIYPQLRASRRLLRAIRVWLQHEKNVNDVERKELWQKVEKRAQAIYGEELSLPAPEEFKTETAAAFVVSLRDWLEGARAEQDEKTRDGEKKNFFQRLFNREG